MLTALCLSLLLVTPAVQFGAPKGNVGFNADLLNSLKEKHNIKEHDGFLLNHTGLSSEPTKDPHPPTTGPREEKKSNSPTPTSYTLPHEVSEAPQNTTGDEVPVLNEEEVPVVKEDYPQVAADDDIETKETAVTEGDVEDEDEEAEVVSQGDEGEVNEDEVEVKEEEVEVKKEDVEVKDEEVEVKEDEEVEVKEDEVEVKEDEEVEVKEDEAEVKEDEAEVKDEEVEVKEDEEVEVKEDEAEVEDEEVDKEEDIDEEQQKSLEDDVEEQSENQEELEKYIDTLENETDPPVELEQNVAPERTEAPVQNVTEPTLPKEEPTTPKGVITSEAPWKPTKFKSGTDTPRSDEAYFGGEYNYNQDNEVDIPGEDPNKEMAEFFDAEFKYVEEGDAMNQPPTSSFRMLTIFLCVAFVGLVGYVLYNNRRRLVRQSRQYAYARLGEGGEPLV